MKKAGSYEPWHEAEFQRLDREIVGVTWCGGRLRVEIQEGMQPPTLTVSFDMVRAYQGLDEGCRLLDSPDWTVVRALIYRSRSSSYLAHIKENAAGMLDNLNISHWLIASCNECVDVISECEPIVNWL